MEIALISDDDRLVMMWLHGRPASTRTEYQRDISHFLRIVAKPLKSTTLADLQHYQDTLIDRQLKPATLRRKINAVKSLYTFAAKLAYLPFNIAAALRLPRAKAILAQRFLLKTQVQALIAATPPGRDRALVLFLYATGTRISEACSLSWANVWTRGDGAVQAAITGKGEKLRTVLVPVPAWQQLQPLQPSPPNPAALVFNLNRYQSWAIIKRASLAAGLGDKVSPHWLRHAHAQHSLAAGAPIHLVRDSLGHSSIAVTNVYLEACPDDSSSKYLDF
jgi:integrase/recombinase XerD